MIKWMITCIKSVERAFETCLIAGTKEENIVPKLEFSTMIVHTVPIHHEVEWSKLQDKGPLKTDWIQWAYKKVDKFQIKDT